MPVKAKICGMTKLEDAQLAVSSGAWAIGLILDERSPRYCEPDIATQIASALRREVEVAGVFVNATLDDVVRTADTIGLTMIQLHGDEGPSYCAEVARATGLKTIKAARVKNAASIRELTAFATDFHMLDTHVEGIPGGTGKSFDWSLASAHPRQPPLILSGGLTPDNVGQAIEQVQPFAVDVASGVESAPGKKDPSKVPAFLDEVARAPAAAA